MRSTQDLLCTLLGKTQFSPLFGFGCHDELVISLLGFAAVPGKVSQFITVVAIRVLGLEPINLHWVNLLDLRCFQLWCLVLSWFVLSSIHILLPGDPSSGKFVYVDCMLSVGGIHVQDEASCIYLVYL